MSHDGSRGRLSLVYSADKQDFSFSAGGDGDLDDAEWQQIELFTSELPDTVIFTSLESTHLETLVEFLKRAHVRQIFDAREIPYFASGAESRARFFDALRNMQVTYISALALARDAGASRRENAAEILGKNIEKGPTLVFSDVDPNLDPDIVDIKSKLAGAGVNYRTVLLNLADAR